jgi:hypothetical protein
MTISPVGVEFSHAGGQTHVQTDGRTDRLTDRFDEANIRFSQFCERAEVWHAEITRYDIVPI